MENLSEPMDVVEAFLNGAEEWELDVISEQDHDLPNPFETEVE